MKTSKILPQAQDLEEVVIGAILIEKEALDAIADIIKPEIFYNDKNRQIYKAIQSLMIKSEPVDLITVSNKLRETGDLDRIGGMYYLTGLTDRVVSASNIEFHARKLQELYIKRELINTSYRLADDCFNPETDVFELLSKSEFEKDILLNTITTRKEISSNRLFKENIDRLLKIHNTPNGITGVRSGFTDLDKITGGWQKSDLIIIAGRPAMGKTAFVISSAVNSAIHHNIPGAIFSLEMSNHQLMNRITSIVSGVPLERFRKGSLNNDDWNKIQGVTELIQNSPIVFDDTPSLSVIEFAAKARRLKRQNNIQWIVIDYLQLMIGKISKGTNREQEIAGIARTLKGVAKELDIPIIALSQLSRAVESRTDKRPMLSDLRESGAIEQDADIVCFLYRPEYYGIDQDSMGSSTIGLAEFIIAKHRNGATDDVVLRYVKTSTAFYDDGPYDNSFNNSSSNINISKILGHKYNAPEQPEPF